LSYSLIVAKYATVHYLSTGYQSVVYITTHGTGGSRGWRSNQVHPVYQGDYTCPQPVKTSVSADGHRTLFIVRIMLT